NGSHRWRGKPAQIGLRHVISISHPLLGRMGRDHGVAGSIEQDPLQGSVVLGPRRDVMGSLLSQSPLHGLKQLAELSNTDRFLFVWLYRWFPSCPQRDCNSPARDDHPLASRGVPVVLARAITQASWQAE